MKRNKSKLNTFNVIKKLIKNKTYYFEKMKDVQLR